MKPQVGLDREKAIKSLLDTIKANFCSDLLYEEFLMLAEAMEIDFFEWSFSGWIGGMVALTQNRDETVIGELILKKPRFRLTYTPLMKKNRQELLPGNKIKIIELQTS